MGAHLTQPHLASRPNGKLWLDNAQNDLVHAAVTRVNLNAVSADFTDGIENIINHRITPVVPGLYQISAQACFVNCVSNKDYEIFIRINGFTRYETLVPLNSAGDRISIACSFPYYLNDDYVELFVRSMAGVDTVDLANFEQDTFLAVTRLS